MNSFHVFIFSALFILGSVLISESEAVDLCSLPFCDCPDAGKEVICSCEEGSKQVSSVTSSL